MLVPGDVDDDGFDDVIFSALRVNEKFGGAIYILLGRKSFTTVVDALSLITVSGPVWSWFGYSVVSEASKTSFFFVKRVHNFCLFR